MTPFEREEGFALRLIAHGGGSRPLGEHPEYDEAAVAFPLEEPDEVAVFLRRDGKTRREFRFRIVPADAPAAPTAAEDAPPRDVRLAMAERFLRDTLDVLRALPGSLQRAMLRKALGHLVAGGQLQGGEAKLLEAVVRVWPSGP